MSKTHWRTLTDSKYLGIYSLPDGEDMIVTMKHIVKEKVIGEGGKSDNCPVLYFSDADKPMIVNKTNFKMIEKLYGKYIEGWPGKKIQLYEGHEVLRGAPIEGLRIRPFVPKCSDPTCSACGSFITAYGKMTPAQLSEHTRKKYGKALCSDCAKAAAEQASKPDAVTVQIEKQQSEQQEESNG